MKAKIEKLDVKAEKTNININAQLEAARCEAQNMKIELAKKIDANNVLGVMLSSIVGITGIAFGLFYFSFNLVVKPQLDDAKKEVIETQKQNKRIIELLEANNPNASVVK